MIEAYIFVLKSLLMAIGGRRSCSIDSVGEFNVHCRFEIWRFVSGRIFVVKIDINFWGPLCESDDSVFPPPHHHHQHYYHSHRL
jgi:mannose-6-phosphate isomerase-like protein (cupin superfamily)